MMMYLELAEHELMHDCACVHKLMSPRYLVPVPVPAVHMYYCTHAHLFLAGFWRELSKALNYSVVCAYQSGCQYEQTKKQQRL